MRRVTYICDGCHNIMKNESDLIHYTFSLVKERVAEETSSFELCVDCAKLFIDHINPQLWPRTKEEKAA